MCLLVSRRRTPYLLFATVLGQVEGQHTFVVHRPPEYFRMTEGPYRIVIPGKPMVLHAAMGKFVILRMSFVMSGSIDQLHKVIYPVISRRLEQRELRTVSQFFRQRLQKV